MAPPLLLPLQQPHPDLLLTQRPTHVSDLATGLLLTALAAFGRQGALVPVEEDGVAEAEEVVVVEGEAELVPCGGF